MQVHAVVAHTGPADRDGKEDQSPLYLDFAEALKKLNYKKLRTILRTFPNAALLEFRQHGFLLIAR